MTSEYAIKLSQAFGFLREWEVLALQVAVRDVVYACLPGKPKIVNVGAGAGTSGLSIVEAGADPHFVWTVDICPGGPLGGLENERNAFKNAGSLVLPVQILGDSKVVGQTWKEGVLDLVFIDGDHSPEGIAGDITAWLPWVKRPGGWMLFHDYHSNNWPAVVEAVDRMLDFAPVAFSVDTLHARRLP